jgi:hypothetical protein
MLTYINHIFDNLSNYSKKLDDVTLFQNQKWINIDEIGSRKKLFIFRPDNKLLISINGSVKRGLWEYIDSSTLLIEIDDEPILLRHAFIDDEFLLLNQDSTENYALFIKENENLIKSNTLEEIQEYLENKYSTTHVKGYIDNGFNIKSYKNSKYQILNKLDCFDIAWGNYLEIQIKFDFSINTDSLYFGKSSQKYFLIDKDFKRIYKNTFDEAIDLLYSEALLRINKTKITKSNL